MYYTDVIVYGPQHRAGAAVVWCDIRPVHIHS